MLRTLLSFLLLLLPIRHLELFRLIRTTLTKRLQSCTIMGGELISGTRTREAKERNWRGKRSSRKLTWLLQRVAMEPLTRSFRDWQAVKQRKGYFPSGPARYGHED